MKRILIFLIAAMAAIAGAAQAYPPAAAPGLEFVLQLKVNIGEAYAVGATPRGQRYVVPITGGTFEGPGIRGTVVPGGADYQLATDDGRRTELEAIYCIRTDDGTNIHVRNRGIVVSGNAANGAPRNYFMAAPVFEAPSDSRYAWLNDAIYVCAPEFVEGFPGIVLNVWRVTAP